MVMTEAEFHVNNHQITISLGQIRSN